MTIINFVDKSTTDDGADALTTSRSVEPLADGIFDGANDVTFRNLADKMTKELFEAALDGLRLETCLPEFLLGHEEWHLCRRGGHTRPGKKETSFLIPIRFHLMRRDITHVDFIVNGSDWSVASFWFRVRPSVLHSACLWLDFVPPTARS